MRPDQLWSTQLSVVMLQPTPACNLNCHYCYLPNRKTLAVIDGAVVSKVANVIQQHGRPVDAIWHGGEPLMIGSGKFGELLAIFDGHCDRSFVHHTAQTNATLIDDDWCQLFREYSFTLGISLDGPPELNNRRRNWGGRRADSDVLRGIHKLREASIPFGAIAVVGHESLDRAVELYEFFCELGCNSLGIAIEETKGVNHSSALPRDAVERFWLDLMGAWRQRPMIRVRELDRLFSWVASLGTSDPEPPMVIDSFPSVAYNGDVTLLSPEFTGVRSRIYGSFVAGNVLDRGLDEIIRAAKVMPYVSDFLKGVVDCHASCEYFSYCRGGQASNKYFEIGTTRATITRACTNGQRSLVDAGLKFLDTV